MLRGNYTVRMDDKGRIKLPAAYRRYIDEHYSAEFYVTSLTGECARALLKCLRMFRLIWPSNKPSLRSQRESPTKTR